ncbi:VOC family protein [Spirillospora albida]|uniref:VOC family protein n=1 Tax=Spirillospora albida TaxID=58123 RepID=UPI0004C092E6|nr:VOC family protein [Spirillospora albida]
MSESTNAKSTGAKVRIGGLSVDCADPAELARFYADILDLPAQYESEEFVLLGREGMPGIGFVRNDDYRAPTWPSPDVPQQVHFEFGVDDLDQAQAELVALGATTPKEQPQPDRWRVLLDPAGHPFCISTRT